MEQRELRLIRDALEAVLAPELAREVIEAARRQMPDALDAPENVVRFVDGPIRRAITRVHGAAGDDIVDDLLGMLVPEERHRRPSEEVTREVRLDAQLLVIVLSSSEELARALDARFEPGAVTVVAYDDVEGPRRAAKLRAAAMVLIDGASFPRIELADIPDALALFAPETLRAVWATDAPYGASVVSILAARHVSFTPLDRREGITPIVDLVRARRMR